MQLKTILALFIVAVFIISCGGGTEQNTGNEQLDLSDSSSNNATTEARTKEAEKIFYLLPSPIETASLLKKAGAIYNAKHLNNPDNVSNYSTTESKAFALGVYGTDLSYTSIFDQPKAEMKYVAAAKKLADDLGVTNAFDEKTIQRIEANVNDKDSMLNIISEVYWIADAHLKENDRANISAMVIAGGWIEGLYIACKIAGTEEPNPAIVKRIAEQKYSLEHLLHLMETYQGSQPIDEVISELNSLHELFGQIEMKKTSTVSSKNESTGVTTISGGNELNLDDDILEKIVTKIEEIRNKHIQ